MMNVSHLLKKMGRNSEYRDLDIKRDVNGNVQFESIVSESTNGGTLELTGTYNGPIQAYQIKAKVSGTGTPAPGLSITGATFGEDTELTLTATTGSPSTISAMLDTLSPSYSLLGSTTNTPDTVTISINKEQTIES